MTMRKHCFQCLRLPLRTLRCQDDVLQSGKKDFFRAFCDRRERFYGLNTQTRHFCRRAAGRAPQVSLDSKLKEPSAAKYSSFEDAHGHELKDKPTDVLDQHIEQLIKDIDLHNTTTTSVPELHSQYRERSGHVINRVIPYEENPPLHRRADLHSHARERSDSDKKTKTCDGHVIVVHASISPQLRNLHKVCVCSGFVVNAVPADGKLDSKDIIITCAHTLEEMHRYVQYTAKEQLQSFSFIITSSGETRVVEQILSSMPRSDLIVLEISPGSTNSSKLSTLPLSPFPVYTGMPVLTHLFGSPDAPKIRRSKARIVAKSGSSGNTMHNNTIEQPIEWLHGKTWRRWGRGIMLGYRSYTGQEIEAGVSSVLPHILTSILPTSGSSGGPLVNAETGSVVGVISGRRMDNRVEGERGWGASAEGIFEMFSLPGFEPASQKRP